MIQLLLHLIGDYLFQTDWMAKNKVSRWIPCLAHTILYSAPFLLIGSWEAVVVIFVTHTLIDRFRLIKYFLKIKEIRWCFLWRKSIKTDKRGRLKDFFGNLRVFWNVSYREFGYSQKDKPEYMWVWLMIIADNTVHLVINYLALYYL